MQEINGHLCQKTSNGSKYYFDFSRACLISFMLSSEGAANRMGINEKRGIGKTLKSEKH